MNRWLQLIIALAWVVAVVTQYYGIGGGWRIIPFTVAGACHVIQMIERRRVRKDDEHTTLKLQLGDGGST